MSICCPFRQSSLAQYLGELEETLAAVYPLGRQHRTFGKPGSAPGDVLDRKRIGLGVKSHDVAAGKVARPRTCRWNLSTVFMFDYAFEEDSRTRRRVLLE